MKTITITLKIQGTDEDVQDIWDDIDTPSFDLIDQIKSVFKKQNKLHITSKSKGSKGMDAVVEGFITTVLQPEPVVHPIEVYLIDQCKQVEIWFVQDGRRLRYVKDQYPMDTRYELRENKTLKSCRIDRSDWPDVITHDYDFKRHQDHEDSLNYPDDPEEADEYVTKIYKIV